MLPRVSKNMPSIYYCLQVEKSTSPLILNTYPSTQPTTFANKINTSTHTYADLDHGARRFSWSHFFKSFSILTAFLNYHGIAWRIFFLWVRKTPCWVSSNKSRQQELATTRTLPPNIPPAPRYKPSCSWWVSTRHHSRSHFVREDLVNLLSNGVTVASDQSCHTAVHPRQVLAHLNGVIHHTEGEGAANIVV